MFCLIKHVKMSKFLYEGEIFVLNLRNNTHFSSVSLALHQVNLHFYTKYKYYVTFFTLICHSLYNIMYSLASFLYYYFVISSCGLSSAKVSGLLIICLSSWFISRYSVLCDYIRPRPYSQDAISLLYERPYDKYACLIRWKLYYLIIQSQ